MQIKNLLILFSSVLALILIFGLFKSIFTLSETPLLSTSKPVSDSTWPVEILLPIESLDMNSASFEETGCYGTCPIYKMTITEYDRYIIIPEMFTKLENETHGRLPGGTFYELAKIVEQSKFDNKDLHYSEYGTSKEKMCHGYGTDSSTSIFAIKTQNQSANFNMYWGCTGVSDLEDIKLLFKEIEIALDLKNLVYPVAEDKEKLFK